MKVYNINSLKNTHKHILDPDYLYLEYDSNHNLYHYFKQLSIPQTVNHITGVYIQFEIGKILYENNSYIYQKFSHHIQNKIETYLNFDNTELLNMNSNIFFLTMFDISEDTLILACLELHKDLNKRNYKQQPLNVRIGIYFSQPIVSPYQFYQMAKEQFENTLIHDGSLISVKYLSMMK